MLEGHPEEFGSLFQQTIIEADEDSTLHVSLTNLLHQVWTSFSVSDTGGEMYKSNFNDFCLESNLCPFFIVASYTGDRRRLGV